MFQTHCKVVRDAIDVVLRNANSLPPSREREEVYAKLRECRHETDRWEILPGTNREMDTLMKQVLSAHVTVTKLTRAVEPCAQPCAT
ncbi:MAG TPA: hypothetical protein VHV30_17150 [Polyangiaceae bacterium]|jgi:hypothetical protein|nr:hypothetical protein [Polyangiaceae bacterium]